MCYDTILIEMTPQQKTSTIAFTSHTQCQLHLPCSELLATDSVDLPARPHSYCPPKQVLLTASPLSSHLTTLVWTTFSCSTPSARFFFLYPPYPLSRFISISISSGSGDLFNFSRSLSRMPFTPLDPVRLYVLRHAFAYLPCSDLVFPLLTGCQFP